MQADGSRVGASFLSKQASNNPRELVIKLIETNKCASKDDLFKKFQEAVEDEPSYERAVRWYFFVNMYDYAVRPERSHVATRATAAVVEQMISKAVQSIKRQVVMLDLTMPNGKPMKECTGAEMAKFGNRYQKIAAQVGKTKTVGSVLSEEQVKKILT